MKAIFASLATAVVLAGAAWAGNVTPGNLAALTHKVNQLEVQEAKLAGRLATLEQTSSCLQTQWNTTGYQPYIVESVTWGSMNPNHATLYASPSAADGQTASGYLLASPKVLPQC